LLLARVKVPPERHAPQRNFFRQSFDGFFYAVRHPGIGQMMILFAITTVSIRGYNELFPGFADNIFQRGAQGLAWLSATVGLGAMTGGVWIILRQTGMRGLTGLAINNTLVMSLSVLAFAATTSYWFALATVFVGGFAQTVSGISAQTLVQTAVPPTMRGRVMAFYAMVFRAGPALGALISGWLATRLGFRLPVALGAVICVMSWVWARLRQEQIRHALEDPSEPAPEPAAEAASRVGAE
jgi:predicted MFS family arabinose efflux permease